MALHLFPERFTAEEIADGVRALLLHAPAHLLAAARLSGYDVVDLLGDKESSPPES